MGIRKGAANKLIPASGACRPGGPAGEIYTFYVYPCIRKTPPSPGPPGVFDPGGVYLFYILNIK